MKNTKRGRRRNPKNRIDPGIPFVWKVSGIIMLAIVAAIGVIIALNA